MKVMLLNPPSRFAKNVVRDLFYGCWCRGKRIASARFPPTTLLYIASVLEKDGHNVTLLDSQSEDMGFEQVKREVHRKEPEAVIIPTATMTFREDVQTLRELKGIVDAKTLAFGNHVTFLPKVSLSEDGIDYIVMREPEYIIRDFVNALEKGESPERTRGIGYRKGKSVRINPPYPFIKNLDEIPFPNRDYIKRFVYFNPLVKKLPWTTAITSRGCPGRCNFCSSPNFYGNVLRFRSAENVVDEIEEIRGMGYREVFFRDETFTADPRRLESICNLITERGIDISWICNARIGNLTKERMEQMKRAGCHLIKFGVESGVQEILDNIEKGIRVEMTEKTFRWTNEIGMETHAHMMLGCIGESRETVNKTIGFLKGIRPTTATFAVFTPFPGTRIFEAVKKQAPEAEDGSSCDVSKIHTTGFYSRVFCELDDRELGRAIHRAYREFYMRPTYIARRLRSVRSLDEFRRVVSAGFDILTFVAGKE